MRLRAWFDLWERKISAFGISPWSTILLAIYGAFWIGTEAYRGKAIGWDGYITLILGEIALATLRSMKK